MGYLEQIIKNMRHKKLIISLIVIVVIIFGGLIGGSLYMIDYSLRPENRGKDLAGSEAYMRDTYPQINGWLDSIQENKLLKDTFITANDGIRLHAYYAYASSPTKKTAVIVHGYTDSAIRMFHIGYMYNQSLGYNIIIPDLRYTGLDKPHSKNFRRLYTGRSSRNIHGSSHHHDDLRRSSS